MQQQQQQQQHDVQAEMNKRLRMNFESLKKVELSRIDNALKHRRRLIYISLAGLLLSLLILLIFVFYPEWGVWQPMLFPYAINQYLFIRYVRQLRGLRKHKQHFENF